MLLEASGPDPRSPVPQRLGLTSFFKVSCILLNVWLEPFITIFVEDGLSPQLTPPRPMEPRRKLALVLGGILPRDAGCLALFDL